jgi:hypothetical protein
MGFAVLGLFMFEALHPNSVLVVRDYRLPVILSGVGTAMTAWWWLGRANRFRAYCGKPVLGPLFAWDTVEVQRKRRAAASTSLSQPHPVIDRYFLAAIKRCEHPGLAQHIWGAFYTTLLQMIPEWKTGILAGLGLLACILWAGYDPSSAPFFITIFPLIGAMSMDELHSSLFLELPIASGRRERFYATIVLLGIAAGVSILGLVLTILTLNLLMPLVPEVCVGGRTLTFHPIPLRLLELPMVAFPLLGLASIWLSKKAFGRLLPGVVIAAWMLLVSHGTSVPGLPLKAVLFVTILAWLICALGIRRIAMRSDLVRQ